MPLTEQFVDESTPAYSFKEADEKVPKKKTGTAKGDEARSNFQKDMQNRSIESSSQRPRKQSKAERNREVAEKARKDEAIRRAAASPLATAGSPVGADAPASVVSFDDVKPLTVRSKSSGEVRQ